MNHEQPTATLEKPIDIKTIDKNLTLNHETYTSIFKMLADAKGITFTHEQMKTNTNETNKDSTKEKEEHYIETWYSINEDMIIIEFEPNVIEIHSAKQGAKEDSFYFQLKITEENKEKITTALNTALDKIKN